MLMQILISIKGIITSPLGNKWFYNGNKIAADSDIVKINTTIIRTDEV